MRALAFVLVACILSGCISSTEDGLGASGGFNTSEKTKTMNNSKTETNPDGNSVTVSYSCVDTDGRNNYLEKGAVILNEASGSKESVKTQPDKCVIGVIKDGNVSEREARSCSGDGCMVVDGFCQKKPKGVIVAAASRAECPSGCSVGACPDYGVP